MFRKGQTGLEQADLGIVGLGPEELDQEGPPSLITSADDPTFPNNAKKMFAAWTWRRGAQSRVNRRNLMQS